MADLLDAVRAGGLLRPSQPVVVLLSGGRDSVCLLDVACRLGADVRAAHVNYGLRGAAAHADAALCAAVCERLGVPLDVIAAGPPEPGNLQAWARRVRYAAAAGLARTHGADVATGHTATDQVETVLYRLAASPGRRALLGMRAERPLEGAEPRRLLRPLLGVDRAQTAAHCAARGLPYADDATNAGTTFARGRVRHGVVPALRAVHPAAEANVLRTVALLRDEAAVLDAAVGALLDDGAIPLDRLARAPAALGRLVLQHLADAAAAGDGGGAADSGAAVAGDRAAGSGDAGRAPAVGGRLPAVLAAGARGGTRVVDLGGGLRAEVSYGVVRVRRARDARPQPEPAVLPVPGHVAFGGGALRAERGPGLPVADGTFDATALGDAVTVRCWRRGDRVRPLGLGGSRSLQDLFTDRRIPRAERHRVPVLEAHGEIAWVPGVATGERFRVTAATQERVRVSWQPAARPYD